MLKTIIWKTLSKKSQEEVLLRPAQKQENIVEKTQSIITEVRNKGDAALKQFTENFDQVKLEKLKVQESEFAQAKEVLSQSVHQAIQHAAEKIQIFHQAQFPKNITISTAPGIQCELHYRPINKVGFYVPGGSACLISTVLMLGIPARIAGCHERILCTPPQKDGSIHPAILVAANYCGINQVFKVGGAQAIAAMAYGTETIPKVYKIFGPGNAWVTQAKILVSLDPEGASYDLAAGPTEQMLIADHTTNPIWAAADLLSQLEHGPDSQIILISNHQEMIKSIALEIEKQLKTLPRHSIAEKALTNSYAILVDNLFEAIQISNEYAPEHLLLQIENPRQYVEHIHHAGSVFLGHFASESVGDYASGTNHVLPTYGYVKSASGLGLLDFMQKISFQSLTAQGLASISETVQTLAKVEGLEGHRRAIELRMLETKIQPQENIDFISQLARPEIAAMTAYRSARSEKKEGKIFLNANESPWDSDDFLNRYPEKQPPELIHQLSLLYNISEEMILVTRGSDEGIDLLIRAFCNAGQDAIMITPPTYGMYEISAITQNAAIVKVPLLKEKAFELDVESILKSWQPQIKMIFLCSPNNPTGNILNKEKILNLCAQLNNKALIIVDEAYIEFSQTESLIQEIKRFPNLVILRTLSKIHGLAALRCGVVIAIPEVIQLLGKIIAPYPISLPVIKIVLEALSKNNLKKIEKRLEEILKEKVFLMNEIKKINFVNKVWPSEGNFILFEVKENKKILEACEKAGIIIRDRSYDEGLQNCVRVTVGTEEQNKEFLSVLQDLEKTTCTLKDD